MSKVNAVESYDREMVADMCALAAQYISDKYNESHCKRFYVECMSAYEFQGGCLFALFENNRPYGFAYVFQAAPGEYGAAHLHLLAVTPGHRNKGYGHILMEHVQQEYSHLLTLECKDDMVGYFEKYGFNQVAETDNLHVKMVMPGAENKLEFQKPVLNDQAIELYLSDYSKALERLADRGFISIAYA